LNAGRETADKAIRQNEKDSHTALEEMRKTKEGAECERLIGMFVMIYDRRRGPIFREIR
jgi:hypothetical protein